MSGLNAGKNKAFFLSLIFVIGILSFPSIAAAADQDSSDAKKKVQNEYSPKLFISESVTPFPPDIENMFELFRDGRKFCGNGKKDEGEECDATAADNKDSCNQNCLKYDADLCGNGKKDPGEQCDPNEGSSSLSGCAKDCTFTVALNSPKDCNNGVQEEEEACDTPGQEVESNGATYVCNSSCELQQPTNCGNGKVDVGEDCDGTPDCSNACSKIPVCGDSAQEGGEECDDGNADSGDGCSASCVHEILCGDSIVEGRELCDDGNLTDGDGCSAACTNEAVCGNGDLQTGEECDDGNTVSEDGCSSSCTVEDLTVLCGNGTQSADEECDDGNATSGDGCSSACLIEESERSLMVALCGNGTQDEDEDCGEPGLPVCAQNAKCNVCQCVSAGGCATDADCASGMSCNLNTQSCELQNVCGNGILDSGEDCDDGNTASADGCSASCENEPPPVSCGNGQLDAGEACDDRNTTSGDGCSSSCTVELAPGQCFTNTDCPTGKKCNSTTQICEAIPVCGDHKLNIGVEECDDGNLEDCDGCSTTCKNTTNVGCPNNVCGMPGVENPDTAQCETAFDYNGASLCVCPSNRCVVDTDTSC